MSLLNKLIDERKCHITGTPTYKILCSDLYILWCEKKIKKENAKNISVRKNGAPRKLPSVPIQIQQPASYGGNAGLRRKCSTCRRGRDIQSVGICHCIHVCSLSDDVVISAEWFALSGPHRYVVLLSSFYLNIRFLATVRFVFRRKQKKKTLLRQVSHFSTGNRTCLIRECVTFCRWQWTRWQGSHIGILYLWRSADCP